MSSTSSVEQPRDKSFVEVLSPRERDPQQMATARPVVLTYRQYFHNSNQAAINTLACPAIGDAPTPFIFAVAKIERRHPPAIRRLKPGRALSLWPYARPPRLFRPSRVRRYHGWKKRGAAPRVQYVSGEIFISLGGANGNVG